MQWADMANKATKCSQTNLAVFEDTRAARNFVVELPKQEARLAEYALPLFYI